MRITLGERKIHERPSKKEIGQGACKGKKIRQPAGCEVLERREQGVVKRKPPFDSNWSAVVIHGDDGREPGEHIHDRTSDHEPRAEHESPSVTSEATVNRSLNDVKPY